MRKSAAWSIHGVDFTSRPRLRKPITIASGHAYRLEFRLDTLEQFADWEQFETWLRRRGPWITGFDFPFGLPREAVEDLGWPKQWSQLVAYCRGQGREAVLESPQAGPEPGIGRELSSDALPEDRP